MVCLGFLVGCSFLLRVLFCVSFSCGVLCAVVLFPFVPFVFIFYPLFVCTGFLAVRGCSVAVVVAGVAVVSLGVALCRLMNCDGRSSCRFCLICFCMTRFSLCLSFRFSRCAR